MKRRRPRAFWMQGLRPARRYAIELEGVSNRKDRAGEPVVLLLRINRLPLFFVLSTARRAQHITYIRAWCQERCSVPGLVVDPSSDWCSAAVMQGSLITPDSSNPDLTIVAVSHDRPGELPSGGEVNLWGALEGRLRTPWQGVEAILHVGGQVWRLGETLGRV